MLIGFMGAGKSSVGRRLQERTGFPRFDTDEMIAAKFGLPIAQIFEIHGEDAFREAESAMLRTSIRIATRSSSPAAASFSGRTIAN